MSRSRGSVRLASFHISIDDVFDCLIDIVDRGQSVARQPVLGFCEALAAEGAPVDLYVFRSAIVGGRLRRLDEVGPAAAERLAAVPGIRFGPHAEDYATAPHAQPLDAQRETMAGLFAAIGRFASARQRSRWLRLHYFSECYELAPLWRSNGVEALFTTDKPAIAYRLPEEARESLRLRGAVDFGGIGFRRSHLRLESFADEAADLPRFLARIDAALADHGFVTLFTHEVDIADPRVRTLALASVRHLVGMGAAPVQPFQA